MTSQIVRAHNGRLPDDICVVFANTGAESEATLRFVDRFAKELEVNIAWVEFDWDAPHRTRIVDFETASRAGEPYAKLIDRKGFVPNVTLRFCTSYLKREPIAAFARHFIGWKAWHSVIGLRADERKRVLKMLARNCGSATGEWAALPMNDANVSEAKVQEFWAKQKFDLELAQGEGNCTFCFLKGKKKLLYLMRKFPQQAQWWLAQEMKVKNRTNEAGEKTESLKRFREHETYAELFKQAMEQDDFFIAPTERDEIDCICTD